MLQTRDFHRFAAVLANFCRSLYYINLFIIFASSTPCFPYISMLGDRILPQIHWNLVGCGRLLWAETLSTKLNMHLWKGCDKSLWIDDCHKLSRTFSSSFQINSHNRIPSTSTDLSWWLLLRASSPNSVLGMCRLSLSLARWHFRQHPPSISEEYLNGYRDSSCSSVCYCNESCPFPEGQWNLRSHPQHSFPWLIFPPKRGKRLVNPSAFRKYPVILYSSSTPPRGFDFPRPHGLFLLVTPWMSARVKGLTSRIWISLW